MNNFNKDGTYIKVGWDIISRSPLYGLKGEKQEEVRLDTLEKLKIDQSTYIALDSLIESQGLSSEYIRKAIRSGANVIALPANVESGTDGTEETVVNIAYGGRNKLVYPAVDSYVAHSDEVQWGRFEHIVNESSKAEEVLKELIKFIVRGAHGDKFKAVEKIHKLNINIDNEMVDIAENLRIETRLALSELDWVGNDPMSKFNIKKIRIRGSVLWQLNRLNRYMDVGYSVLSFKDNMAELIK